MIPDWIENSRKGSNGSRPFELRMVSFTIVVVSDTGPLQARLATRLKIRRKRHVPSEHKEGHFLVPNKERTECIDRKPSATPSVLLTGPSLSLRPDESQRTLLTLPPLDRITVTIVCLPTIPLDAYSYSTLIS